MSKELSWFNMYYNSNVLLNNVKQEQFIKKLSNKTDEKNLDIKISQIEKDYNDKLKEIEILCSNVEEIEKLKLMNSLLILQKELEIIKLLTKYTLQNKNLNHTFLVSCLNVLLLLSDTLRQRLGQKELVHEKIVNENDPSEFIISRCSYKFCTYQDNCTYNYNQKSKNLCYQDHYVHNMVSADLRILIDYINLRHEKNNNIMHNKEILKTINTLSFVIGHMETELRTKCLYLPESDWESLHYIKNK